jgi:hypothetical protein
MIQHDHAAPLALATLLATIDPGRMLADTRHLCSIEFAGRRVGTDGHARASGRLTSPFRQVGWRVATQEFAL